MILISSMLFVPVCFVVFEISVVCFCSLLQFFCGFCSLLYYSAVLFVMFCRFPPWPWAGALAQGLVLGNAPQGKRAQARAQGPAPRKEPKGERAQGARESHPTKATWAHGDSGPVEWA